MAQLDLFDGVRTLNIVSASSGKTVTFYPNESFRQKVNRAWEKVYGRIEKWKF